MPIDEALWLSIVARMCDAIAPVAIEAYWGSDRGGVHIPLVAIDERPSWRHPRYTQIELVTLPAGRDHTGPSWPEATSAVELGERIAATYRVPFHFASRTRPSDEVIRWWRRGEGRACDDCGLELDQNPGVHWFGMCYACHLAREDRQPRLRVHLRRDVDAGEYDQIRMLLDAALYAARVGMFHAGSRIARAQTIWFLASDAQRAAEIAERTLRDVGLPAEVRVEAGAGVR